MGSDVVVERLISANYCRPREVGDLIRTPCTHCLARALSRAKLVEPPSDVSAVALDQPSVVALFENVWYGPDGRREKRKTSGCCLIRCQGERFVRRRENKAI